MNLRVILIATVANVSVNATGLAADSGKIIVTPNLKEFCRSTPVTHRKTIIYVDLASVRRSDTEWGLTLLNKLELGPREAVTVLGVNPSTFEVIETLNSCYPTLTRDEIAASRENRGVWEKLTQMDPEAQQRENVQTFDSQLRNALNKIVEASSKVPQTGNKRNLLGAIAIDKNRFRDQQALYRLIIYTDGAISDTFSSATPNENDVIRALTEKYQANFSGAEIHVYGVRADENGMSLDAKQKTFAAFFLSSGAHVRSFATSLAQQEGDAFDPAKTMRGIFEGAGSARGSVKLALVTRKDSAARAWLTFVLGTGSLAVPFEGEYSCGKDECTLKARALENIPIQSTTPYFRKDDQLVLSGTLEGEYEGEITPAGREVFDAKDGKDVRYLLKFRGR